MNQQNVPPGPPPPSPPVGQLEAEKIKLQIQQLLRLPPRNPQHTRHPSIPPSSSPPTQQPQQEQNHSGPGVDLVTTDPNMTHRNMEMNTHEHNYHNRRGPWGHQVVSQGYQHRQQTPPQGQMQNNQQQSRPNRPELVGVPRFSPKGRNSGNHGQRPGRPNTQQYREGLSSSQRKVKDSIFSCLRDPNCPEYIRKEEQRIIEAAFDEMKPTYYVNFMDPILVQILKIHTIEPMQKRNPKFPRAKYFCNACYYHMDTIQSILIHLISIRHLESLKIRNIGEMLEHIPPPSQGHADSLTTLLMDLHHKIGMNEEDIENRMKAAKFVDGFVSTQILYGPSNLTLIGSTVPGFGFKWSDINLNLDFSNVLDSTAFVFKIAWGLRAAPELFSDVQIQSHRITFTLLGPNTRMVIHFNNKGAERTAELFQKFNKIDSRVRPLVIAFRYVAALLGVDISEDGYWPPHCFTILVLKHLQDIRILPFIVTRNFDAAHDYEYGHLTDEDIHEWKGRNNDSLGRIWLSLLKKWAMEFPFDEFVVTLLHTEVSKKSDSGIWNRKLSIQDPTHLKSNLSRSAFHGRVNDYLINRFKHLFHYFGVPRLANGKGLFEGIIPEAEIPDPKKIHFFDCVLSCRDQSLKIRVIDMANEFGEVRPYVLKEDVGYTTMIKVPSEFVYEFSTRVFESQQKKPVYCKSCGGEGHARKTCPSERISPGPKFNRPSGYTLQRLSGFIENTYAEDGITDDDIKARIRITQEIDDALRPVFPELQLKLFGSTFNGFGLHNSDIDIAMRVDGRSFHKGDIPTEEVAIILDKVNSRLSATGSIDDLRCIATAKVPIVKFRHAYTMLEGDISLSNDLALRNTELLNTYTVIDPRLKMLGCFIKKLTKLCDISDASKGSLSSYAYVILLIHYLQRTEPPVLPVLQELPGEGSGRPQYIVDGWDAYFWNFTAELHLVWPGLGQNNLSLSELFLGFLDYYTREFNFKNYVVTIRRSAPLSREEKMWISDTLICIEDPFDLGHNLGQGVTNRMGCHIIKTLQRFREIFYKSIDGMHFSGPNMREFWLNPKRLIISDIPIDRQCRLCLKIGHTAKHCDAAVKIKSPENGNGIIEQRVNPITSTLGPQSPDPTSQIHPQGFELINQIAPAPPGFQQHLIPHNNLWEQNMGWPINLAIDRDFMQDNDSHGSTDTMSPGIWNSTSGSPSPILLIPNRAPTNVYMGLNSRPLPHFPGNGADSLVAGIHSLGLEEKRQIQDSNLDEYRTAERREREEYHRRMLNAELYARRNNPPSNSPL